MLYIFAGVRRVGTRLPPELDARLVRYRRRLVTVRKATRCPYAARRSGDQRRGARGPGDVITVQRPLEALAKVCRQERVYDGVHAGVGVRQHVRADPEVEERVGATPRVRRIVRPQPDDVGGQPTEAEHRHDDDDESRHLTLHHQSLLVAVTATPSDRVRRLAYQPQLANHERAEHKDGGQRYDVADDEQEQEVGGTVARGAAPVVGTDGDGFGPDVAVDAYGVDDRPRQSDHDRRQPDDDRRRQCLAGRA